MLEKILVCLDGSKLAEQIIPMVTSDLARLKSKVELFRVIKLPEGIIPLNFPGEPGVPYQTSPDIVQTNKEEKEASEYLTRIAESLKQAGVDVSYTVLPGSAGEMIIRFARENAFTAIALATHGHSGIRRVFVGSTADYVLRHSPVPLILVRPE